RRTRRAAAPRGAGARLARRPVDRQTGHRADPPALPRLLPPRARPQAAALPAALKRSAAADPRPRARRRGDRALAGGLPPHPPQGPPPQGTPDFSRRVRLPAAAAGAAHAGAAGRDPGAALLGPA